MSAYSYDAVKWNLSSLLHQALLALAEGDAKTLGASEEQIFKTLERPPESHLGDYAFPCFRFAKALRRKPPEIAEQLAKALQNDAKDWVSEAAVVGAFLNLRMQPTKVAEILVEQIQSQAYFKRVQQYWLTQPRKVMVEYSQPNTHKVFHVGHMRNVALGDSLGRIYEYCGYPVTFVNYIGDEGAHIAKCIWYIRRSAATVPSTDRGEWLGKMYVQACHLLEDASPEEKLVYDQEVSAVLREIESKSGEAYQFWVESRQWSLADFKEIYDWTGARFDHYFYESEVSEESQQIVDEYLEKAVFKEDDGAIGIDLKAEKLGFLIVRKRDGNTTYGTKDLALARRKYDEFDIDRSIYVVGSEQNLHFKQVFKTLEKMGFEKAKDCYHLSYGMVVLPSGKMSSRKGNVIEFHQMRSELDQALASQLEKYRGDWSDADIDQTKHKLAVGAIRYGMICSDPVKDIVFDIKNWLSFEGDTGPYLMYSYARTLSILARAKQDGIEIDYTQLDAIHEQDEIDLLRYLNDFNTAVIQSCELDKPSVLAHYLFDMCKVYNRFIAHLSVLKAPSDEARNVRLALLDCFAKVLRQGLNLLGIEAPERM